jgi:uncharacterized protein YcbK (DUF882 family)
VGPYRRLDRAWLLLCAAVAAVAAGSVAAPTAPEPPRPPRVVQAARDLSSKKGALAEETSGSPLLATLAQTHTEERVLLDADGPDLTRFEGLLADHATRSSHAIDPRLLGLLRTLATRHEDPLLGAPRIEIVSGYRSPKLNEILRKKGHHVASHSQHSQGHAVDFRLVPAGATTALEPRLVEKEIRALGWDGGVGTYPTKDDWFVHADVGPNRRWVN